MVSYTIQVESWMNTDCHLGLHNLELPVVLLDGSIFRHEHANGGRENGHLVLQVVIECDGPGLLASLQSAHQLRVTNDGVFCLDDINRITTTTSAATTTLQLQFILILSLLVLHMYY